MINDRKSINKKTIKYIKIYDKYLWKSIRIISFFLNAHCLSVPDKWQSSYRIHFNIHMLTLPFYSEFCVFTPSTNCVLRLIYMWRYISNTTAWRWKNILHNTYLFSTKSPPLATNLIQCINPIDRLLHCEYLRSKFSL